MKIFFIPKKKSFFLGILLFFLLLYFFFSSLKATNHFSHPLSFAVFKTTEEESPAWLKNIPLLTQGDEKIAYLTFDDGPTVTVTPKILDILQEEEIPASFFVIGKSVEEHPEIVKRSYEEGHYIANHGYSHNNAILYKSAESFLSEIQKTEEAIAKAIEVPDYCSHIFRFPNGFMAPLYRAEKKKAVSLLSKIHYTYIDWNCLTKDAEKKCSTQQLLSNLKETAKDKNTLVVLMHDTKDVNDSSLVLKDVITYLKSEGYKFQNFYDISF